MESHSNSLDGASERRSSYHRQGGFRRDDSREDSLQSSSVTSHDRIIDLTHMNADIDEYARHITKLQWCFDSEDDDEAPAGSEEDEDDACSWARSTSTFEDDFDSAEPATPRTSRRRRPKGRHIWFDDDPPAVFEYERPTTAERGRLYYSPTEYEVMVSEYYLESRQEAQGPLFPEIGASGDY